MTNQPHFAHVQGGLLGLLFPEKGPQRALCPFVQLVCRAIKGHSGRTPVMQMTEAVDLGVLKNARPSRMRFGKTSCEKASDHLNPGHRASLCLLSIFRRLLARSYRVVAPSAPIEYRRGALRNRLEETDGWKGCDPQ